MRGALLRKGTLDWTVRPVRLANGPKKNKIKALVGIGNYRDDAISRADVGASILDCLEQDKFVRQAVGVADRK